MTSHLLPCLKDQSFTTEILFYDVSQGYFIHLYGCVFDRSVWSYFLYPTEY